jgi:hypothetical protein
LKKLRCPFYRKPYIYLNSEGEGLPELRWLFVVEAVVETDCAESEACVVDRLEFKSLLYPCSRVFVLLTPEIVEPEIDCVCFMVRLMTSP